MQRLVFHVFNFQEISGTRHTLEERGSTTVGIAHVDLVAGSWRVELQSLMETHECFEKLKAEGGYGLTHIGSLQKIDGTSFSGQEAEKMLNALCFFFSFAKGIRCDSVCPVGFDDAGNRASITASATFGHSA